MSNSKLVRLMLMAVSLVGLSACASGGGGGGGGGGDEAAVAGAATGEVVSIMIDNDVIPASAVTVYIVPESGGRRRLGNIQGSGRQTFSYSPSARTMQFRLRAEVVGGDDVQSELFNLVGISGIEWATSRTNVRLVR